MKFSEFFSKLAFMYTDNARAGVANTYIDGVKFFWSYDHIARSPLPFNQGLVILGQGKKIGYLNDKTFVYDSSNYLISSVPVSYECETFASEKHPVFGLLVEVDTPLISSLVEKLQELAPQEKIKGSHAYCGVEPAQLDDNMKRTVERLLLALSSKLDAKILGTSLVNELIYCTLRGEHGKALLSLAIEHSCNARISRAISYLHHNYAHSISIDKLALKANMASSTFHRKFKEVTGDTPIQYTKKIRLNRARYLLMNNKGNVTTIAHQVGFASETHFSREFKKQFGVAPKQAVFAPYANMFIE
jgi:AraC-like DNA-binding protein